MAYANDVQSIAQCNAMAVATPSRVASSRLPRRQHPALFLVNVEMVTPSSVNGVEALI